MNIHQLVEQNWNSNALVSSRVSLTQWSAAVRLVHPVCSHLSGKSAAGELGQSDKLFTQISPQHILGHQFDRQWSEEIILLQVCRCCSLIYVLPQLSALMFTITNDHFLKAHAELNPSYTPTSNYINPLVDVPINVLI